ncbi:biotin transporter BioY [Actinomyces sp. B33]|uniref:biotin transporter BioY n=1 Tax=Actinomyces sp. B33 TaxID=2942131 RepID=UPI002341E828|nr:biotin transporter BioY [Actinomyces sp. B33]MDC4232387.1 biotin transporter BioY [Actinomyces sp. B33]
MTTAPASPVLVDDLLPGRTLLRSAALVGAGACAVGLLAQATIPLWPVPVTGQTLGVMLVGAVLGSRRGAAALGLYALLGVAGVPWFASMGGGPAYALQPSFGFVLAFIPTAWVIGRLSERSWDRRPLACVGAFGIASLIPFLIGVPWMWAVLHLLHGKTLGLMATLEAGLIPFVPGGVVKWALGAAILIGARRAVGGRE